ncbi:oligosaccharide flippase family protein [Clostridium sp. CF011]|uniref:oligosaccharide flippase family protein n=1 Tax=Clostridium sp. CF011 TaxID=2843318 RepID=UPI001C0DEC3C|nr:oligosaccharide flippase family protein [Clostridium sp. CF011]MBU3093645.1 oligosaccharide flippase family protein [Clostridium sp. CF011]WAG69349.1 oligosaccharide flippase family protein [Clostridium sp. CF011]
MKKNQLKAGAILSYISLFLSTIISLIYTPFMLRKMGQSEFGLYSLTASVVGYLTILDFGFGNAIVRYTAKYRALNEKEKEYNLNGMFIIVYTIIGIITAIAGIILYLNVGNLFSAKMTTAEIQKAKILMLLLVFNLAVSFPLGIFSSIITAYEEFVFSKVINIIRIIISPCIMIPLLILGYRSIGMVVITTILNISILIINMWFCLTKLRVKLYFKNFDLSLLREIIGYSFYIFLNIIVDKINWSADQFILGTVSGTVAVAIYSVAAQINGYYLSFSTAISGVFLPKLTVMVTKKASNTEFSDLFIKIGRIQYVIIAYILGGFLLVGQDFINIWAGKDYSSAYYIAALLIIPVTVPLIQNLGITLLQAQNRQKFRSIVYVLIAVLNISISIPLAKIYGGIGSAIGTAIAIILGNIIAMNIYYYKKINIDIPQFWKEIFLMTIPATIAFVFCFFISRFIVGSGYSYILIKAFIFTLIYIPLMWFMGMNKYEKTIFSSPIKKIKARNKGDV